jgi:hypothetical protein
LNWKLTALDLRHWIAVLGTILIVFFVQAATVCHVVKCSLPEKPASCHHDNSQPQPDKCKELAATLAAISLDVTLDESAIPEPVTLVPASGSAEPVAHANSPPDTKSVLRI